MSKIKICLDAGHYGKYNRSPVVNEYYESDRVWKLHLLQKKYLEEYGIEVILTRENQDSDLGLTTRGKKAKGCNLFVSNHSNAVGSGVNEDIDYPIVYVPLNGKADAIGEKLAACVESTMGTKQKGRIATRKGNNGDYYGVIRGAVSVGVPGIIIEHSFHTQTRATEWLMDDKNLDKLAKAEADVIAKHFGAEKTNQKEMVEVKVSVLKKGAKGEQVKALQALLIGYGYKMENNGKTYGVDGSFGTATENAVLAYQRKNNLEDDGSVGPKTWSKLLGV
jgi:N-acetylmuramoyl-L-alanine amidase